MHRLSTLHCKVDLERLLISCWGLLVASKGGRTQPLPEKKGSNGSSPQRAKER